MTRGFTIVELLVVITIIVVLLALLAPALDQAIYQAELTVCGARLRVVGSGLTHYALDHRKQYPYRPRARNGVSGAQAAEIRIAANNAKAQDDRPMYRPYLQTLDVLLDPMVQKVNLDTEFPLTHVAASYQLWAGWQIKYAGRLYDGMFRLGDRLQFVDDRFRVIASDMDFNGQQSSHPDHEGSLYNWVMRDDRLLTDHWTLSVWASPGVALFGTIDRNFAMDDNSVMRLESVRHETTEGMADLPTRANADKYAEGQKTYLPRN